MNSLKIERKTIGRDLLAGLIAAIAAIPDGMASATLAGVNPVYGLYNLMVGTPVGALFTSSVYMAVINTSAMALVVLEALAGFSGDEQLKALVTLTVMVGLFQLILALLKLGYLTRFVSNSVMRGFLTGIGIVIILSQLPDFTGYAAQGSNKVTQTLDLLGNMGQVDPYTLGVGVLTIAIIVVLDRTRLSPVSMLVAIPLAPSMIDSPNNHAGTINTARPSAAKRKTASLLRPPSALRSLRNGAWRATAMTAPHRIKGMNGLTICKHQITMARTINR